MGKWLWSRRSYFEALIAFSVVWVFGLLMKLMLQDDYEGTHFLAVLNLFVYCSPPAMLAAVLLDLWCDRLPKDGDSKP